MQIVISVTDLQRKWIENYGFIPDDLNVKMAEVILNGTALSKVIEDIRAEIKDDMDDIASNSIYARDDFNNGVYEGLKMALKDIDKHIKGVSDK